LPDAFDTNQVTPSLLTRRTAGQYDALDTWPTWAGATWGR